MKQTIVFMCALIFLFSTAICSAEFKSTTDNFDGTKTIISYTPKTLPLKEVRFTKIIRDEIENYTLKTSQISAYGSYRYFNPTKPMQIKIKDTIYDIPVIYSSGYLAGVVSSSITVNLTPDIIENIRTADKLTIRVFLTDREFIWESKKEVLDEWQKVINTK